METLRLSWNEWKKAADFLKRGESVAFPTETVFGLGAIASSEEAFARLAELKKRPPEKPFSLMCSSIGEAVRYAEIDYRSRAVLQQFFPGEVTVLLTPRKDVPHHITLGSPFIGIRIPASEQARSLIEAVGGALLVPSANLSGEPAATKAEEVAFVFDGKIAAIIDGECQDGQASTIGSCANGKIALVREGPVPFCQIQEAFDTAECTVALGSDHGGLDYKNAIKEHLLARGFHVLDQGTMDSSSCDYPVFAKLAARAVADGRAEKGILVCTSGEGIMMAANKVPSIRCGIGYDDRVSAKCVEHNNANMISFGQSYMALEDVLRRVDIFLCETFSPNPRHHRRVAEIESEK